MNPPVPPQKQPVENSGGALIKRDAWSRVMAVVLYVEGLRRNQLSGRDRGVRGSGGAALYRLTGALANASSLSSITSASAVPQVFSGTALSDGTGTSTVHNYHDKTFASSSIVCAIPGAGGKLWVTDVRSCTNLS
jgi:hypothetical protein